MELSAANISSLFTGFAMDFQRGFDMPPSYYAQIASLTKSSTAQNIYPFMGRTTAFREWFGEREIQNLEAHAYTLINKHFEDTIGIDLDKISDDTHGVYEPMVMQLGWDAKVHPDFLLFSMIKAALNNVDAPAGSPVNGVPVPVCYDGKTLFSAAHPVGLAGNTSGVANVYTSGELPYWILIDASRPIRPLIYQERQPYRMVQMNALTDEEVFKHKMLRLGVDGRCNVGVGLWQLIYASNADLSNPANYGAAVSAMEQFKTDAGLPFGTWSGPPSSKFLVVPTSLRELGMQLLASEFGAIEGASGAVAAVPGTNIWKGTATLIVSQYL